MVTVYVVAYWATDGGGVEAVFASEDDAFAFIRDKVREEQERDDRIRTMLSKGQARAHRSKWIDTSDGAAKVWTYDDGVHWNTAGESHEGYMVQPMDLR